MPCNKKENTPFRWNALCCGLNQFPCQSSTDIESEHLSGCCGWQCVLWHKTSSCVYKRKKLHCQKQQKVKYTRYKGSRACMVSPEVHVFWGCIALPGQWVLKIAQCVGINHATLQQPSTDFQLFKMMGFDSRKRNGLWKIDSDGCSKNREKQWKIGAER